MTPGADEEGALIRNPHRSSTKEKPEDRPESDSIRLIGTSDEFKSAFPTTY
jgi:hypothetical protein